MTSPANEDDYIEETSYVIMDLTAYRSEETIRSLAHESNGLAISDMTDSQVFAQLGPEIYRGDYDDPVGSYLLFEIEEKKTEPSSLLPMLSSMQQHYDNDNDGLRQQQAKWQAKYQYQVDKVIKMKQVQLGPKTEAVESDNEAPVEEQTHFAPGTSMASFLQG
ncbi:hypothetical protein [Absidia glauca]|uniref:Transcription factor TFIIIC triple barrel domain-containing protein n=1 Tax=Absidia glauca TaxID=4829 RepID=A0A168R9K6_ABSGL|nr:hypothetical protein [Absidia glauca]